MFDVDAPEQKSEAPESGDRTAAAASPRMTDRILALQRSAGNRAVGAALLQRHPTAPPVDPKDVVVPDDLPAGDYHQVDPGDWARKVGPAFGKTGYTGVVVTLGANTAYAFYTDGENVRQVPIRISTKHREDRFKVDISHNVWLDATETWIVVTDPPLSSDQVKKLCEALGYEYNAPQPFWVMLDFEPNVLFKRPQTGKGTRTGDTAEMRGKAKKFVGGLAKTWRDRPPSAGALAGTPTFKERYSERTGWHIRITLDQEQTEVPLNPDTDSDKAVKDRVDAAVKRMRQTYEGDKPKGAKPRTSTENAFPPGSKSDPNGPKPPPWYFPFDTHPAVRQGKALANAAPLPAILKFTPDEADRHPTVMAGATYDFEMEVQWQFAGQYESISAVMNAGYYWELLAASPQDWYRLSGETPPEGTPGSPTAPPAASGTAASGGAQAPTSEPPAPKTEDQSVGSGTKVTRRDDATAARKAESRHVGEDMANDYEEGDYSGFAGEAVAGGFRIVKTQVVSVISDILNRRDPSQRRITFPEPGYYIVRCVEGSTHADEDSKFVRASSVAVLPVKVQLNWGVAKATARKDLERAGTKGAYARYMSELGSNRSTLDAARKLKARFTADPTLAARLSTDPVTAASDLSVLELGVLALTDQNQISVDQLTKDLEAQIKEAEADDHEEKVTSWYGELKAMPDGSTEHPVGASFVQDDSGQQIPLRLMVGQAKDSTDAAPHWVVFDITSAKTRDRYEGRAVANGVPLSADVGGHGIALREALRKFAGKNPYGYGEIGLAWPASFRHVNLKGADLPRHLRSAPDAEKRKSKRRSAYVDIATFLIPVAKAAKLRSLVRGAEVFVALAGAGNAIEALRDRARTGHLSEPGTLLEIVQVIGGVKTLGEGARFVFQANDLVRAVRRVGTSLELLTKLENGIQIISIPFTVREQLKAIDAMKNASGEHKAATLAFVLGRAIKTGVVSVRAIHPGEQTRFYDDSQDPAKPHDPNAPRGTGGAGGGRPGGGGSDGGGGARPVIPPEIHRDLQQFADVYRLVINVRRDPPNPNAPDHAQHPDGRLRADVQWAGTGTAPPRAMSDVEREAFNKMLSSMNIGVVPSGDMSSRTDAPAPLVSIQPAPRGAPDRPSDRGTGQDTHIDVVPPRVSQPKYEDKPPVVIWVPARGGLNKTEQAALDRFVDRAQRNGSLTTKLKDELRAASADQLRQKLSKEIAQQSKVEAKREAGQKAQQTNVPDPREAHFDHERDEGGGVTSRWSGADQQRPSDREIGEAKHVAAATGEPVVLYGNNFAGVDGTIGNPPRLFQLKSAPDAATLTRVITDAKQNAQRHGDRGLELHVVAQGLTMDQANEQLQRSPVTFGAWLGRVVVHVQGGFIPVRSSGRPGSGGDGGPDQRTRTTTPPDEPSHTPRFDDVIESGKGSPKKSSKPRVKAKQQPGEGRQTVSDESKSKPSGEPVSDKTKTPARDDPTPDKKPTPAPTPAPEPSPSERLAQRVGRLQAKHRERLEELGKLRVEEEATRSKRAEKQRQVNGAKGKARERLQDELDKLDEDLADIEAARITKQQQVELIDRALTRELHPLPREQEDVEVSGRDAVDALDLPGRAVGKTPNQEAELAADVAWAVQQGATDIRVNQRQVDQDKKTQGTNRPDLQYTINGKRYYIEYEQPNNPRGWEHARRIIPNDPRGILRVKLVPTTSGFTPGKGVTTVEYTYDDVARRLASAP